MEGKKMGLCANDDLGAAMALHYARESGDKAIDDAKSLRNELLKLEDRVRRLEELLK